MKKFKSMMGLFLSTVLISASVNTGFSAEGLKPAAEEAESLLSGAAVTAEIAREDEGESRSKTQIKTEEITQAEFESSGTFGDVTYSYDEAAGVLTLSGEGAMANIGNSSQAEAQQPWYSYRESIKKVIAEEGVTGIGAYAFYGCTGLTEIDLSSTVASIGSGAFYNCSSLENPVFPNSLTSIGMNAFSGCSSLTEIVLPENINTVDYGAFQYCTGLKEITFPNNGTTVSNLERDVFYGCTSLESVIMEGGIKYIAAYAFYGCSSLKNIDISDSIKYVGMYAFYGCTSLESFTFNDSATRIYNSAFRDCTGLKAVHLPASLKVMENCAFYGCTSLTNIEIPESTTQINGFAFYNCTSLTSITLPEGLVDVSANCFEGCTSLTSITIPEEVSSIQSEAFKDCTGLISVSITGSNTYVVSDAFDGCTNLKSVYCAKGSFADDESLYPEGTELSYFFTPTTGSCGDNMTYSFDETTGTLTISGSGEMDNYSDSYLYLPPWYNFRDEITSIVFEDTVTDIGSYAFEYLTALESVVIPENITSCGSSAFYQCSGLKYVEIKSSCSGIYMFKDCDSLETAVIDEGMEATATGLFEYCDSLKNVSLPESLKTIEEHTFDSCNSLETITLPSSLDSIESNAFADCTALTEITIPRSVRYISMSAFSGCKGLSKVALNEGIKSLGSNIFENCTSLTEINIPDSVTKIESMAFYGCTALSSIKLPAELESIDSRTFYGCSSLTEISLPETILYVDNEAFAYCTSLESITVPANVEYIDYYAFEGCSALTSVTILGDTSIMETNAFTNCTSLKYIYCYAGTKADNSSLYPDGVTIIHLGEETKVEPVQFVVKGIFGGRSVTLTSETEGAVVYYSSTSSSLTTDDACVSNGTTLYFEDFYGTIYTRAYYNGVWSDVSKFVLKIPVVNTPTVTASGSTVTIKSTTPSSFICYTTDGSEPVIETDGTAANGTWLRVNGARTNSGTITAEPGDTVRAVAVRSCFTTSESAAAYVSVSPAAFKVVGTFGGRNVTFTSDTSGAKIYYSSTTSSLTTNDKCISNGETVLFEDFYGTIYARAYYNGKWSNVSRLILKIPTINDPTITYENGKATIRTTTPSCYIYYTTDGTTPSITNGKKLCSNSYGQVSVSSGTTIKAIAVRSCFTNSTVTSYTVS